MRKVKLLRVTTVSMSLRYLLRGQMRFMASRGFEVIMASAKGRELEEVKSFEACRHKTFNLTRTITPFTDLLTLCKLTLWLKREKIEIIHSHTPKAGLIAMLAGKLAKTPHRLHTVAGIPWMEKQGFRRWVFKSIDRLAYAAATKVCPNSLNLKQFMIGERIVNEKKLKVMGQGSSNGIDASFFSPEAIPQSKAELRAKMNLAPGHFVYCFIGRVVNDKGMAELAAAFQQLPKEVRLLLIGPFEDDLDPIPEHARKFFETDPAVQVLGYQNDVRPFLKAADALVFPSYREGFPNAPMQAGAMGLPCIVTDINGCNEIIIEGQNGLLVPVKNTQLLKEKMLLLAQDEKLYRALQANARRLITERFEQQYVWHEIYREYQSLMG